MRILVAEDDKLSRVMLEKTLRQAGYEVTAVEDGEHAMAELAKEDPPRLALLDWMMPGRDGLSVCREIRMHTEQAYTYLILLSSKETKAEIVQGLEAGADDYLTKPFDVEELKARLRAGERILDLEDRLVEARESMRFRATHDLLTSLWNRGVILELVSREIHRSFRENSCTVVMMCDIDHFKMVNDEHGHAAGDEVLREVARRLQHSVRSYDMVGRYGGEEFLVVLNRCDPKSAVARADNLRSIVSGKPIHARGKSLPVTISIGLALSCEYQDGDADEIIRKADTALYAAKAAGRNRVRIARPDGQMEKPLKEALGLEQPQIVT
jgi:two-component system, cell cycle response regulator